MADERKHELGLWASSFRVECPGQRALGLKDLALAYIYAICCTIYYILYYVLGVYMLIA